MRRTSVAGLALALTLALASTASASPLLTLRHDGGAFAREDRYLPAEIDPAIQRPVTRQRAQLVRAAAERAPKRTVPGELARLLAAGAIDQPTHDARSGIRLSLIHI